MATRPGGRLTVLSVLIVLTCACSSESPESALEEGPRLAANLRPYGSWMEAAPERWPPIALVNRIEYEDAKHPIAGCGFLLDTGNEVLAVTAKHVLTYFKSARMDSVSFDGSLKAWTMFPKDRPRDLVVVGELVNEDPEDSLEKVPPGRDWLLFTVTEQSNRIQPLRFRSAPLEKGEAVFVVGWRYTDKNCSQRVHEGEFVKREGQTLLISVKELARNTVGGLSGCPVLDGEGHVIGLMSQKAGRLQRVSAIDHPRSLLAARARTDSESPSARKP